MWQNSRKRQYPGLHDFWETPVQVGDRTSAGNVICTVLMGGAGATASTKEAVEANARLIAAAPALLEALQWLVETTEDPDAAHQGRALDNARAAIQSATGEG